MNKKVILLILILSIYKCNTQTLITLDEAINNAVKNNPEVTAARINVEKEKAIKQRSLNIPRPEVFLEYEGIKGNINNYESRKIGITQEFDFPTVYFQRTDVQNSQIDLSNAGLNKKITEISSGVKAGYYRLMFALALLETSRENIKIYNDFLFAAEKKYEAGESSNLEVLNAKVNKIKFENEVKNIETQIKVVQSELKILMNTDQTVIPKDKPDYTEISLIKENLMNSALINNNDIQIIKYQLAAAEKKISLSKSGFLPELSLSYYNQKLTDASGYWGFELGIGLPLWFWEQTGNIKEANADLRIYENNEINIRNTIESEISSRYEEYLNYQNQINYFIRDALPAANEILRQSQKSYEEGAIGYTEYLQTLNTAFEAVLQYNSVLLDYHLTLIEIEKITGVKIL